MIYMLCLKKKPQKQTNKQTKSNSLDNLDLNFLHSLIKDIFLI